MLAPRGVLLLDVPLAEDDIDESHELPAFVREANSDSQTTGNADSAAALAAAEMRVKVEDSFAELALNVPVVPDMPRKVVESKVLIGGSLTSKARALSRFSKYRVTASSTDRLRRVQAVERYIQNPNISAREPILAADSQMMVDDAQMLTISDPIRSVDTLELRANRNAKDLGKTE